MEAILNGTPEKEDDSKFRVPPGFEEVLVFVNKFFEQWRIRYEDRPEISLRWSTGGDLVRGKYIQASNIIYCVVSKVVDPPTELELPIRTKQEPEGGGFFGVMYTLPIENHVEGAVFILGTQIWRWLVKSNHIRGDSRRTKANSFGIGLLKLFHQWQKLELRKLPEPQEILEVVKEMEDEDK